MERISSIWLHPLYQEQFALLQEAERDRIFCNHTLAHFLDVARLAWISCLEDRIEGNLPDAPASALSKELIYAAALLHDIGRYQQLACGTPHEEAGRLLAGRILPDCGFDDAQTAWICHAIACHRSLEASEGNRPHSVPASDTDGQPADVSRLLAHYIYKADKQSRCCFSCPAFEECNWSMEKRNLLLTR